MQKAHAKRIRYASNCVNRMASRHTLMGIYDRQYSVRFFVSAVCVSAVFTSHAGNGATWGRAKAAPCLARLLKCRLRTRSVSDATRSTLSFTLRLLLLPCSRCGRPRSELNWERGHPARNGWPSQPQEAGWKPACTVHQPYSYYAVGAPGRHTY